MRPSCMNYWDEVLTPLDTCVSAASVPFMGDSETEFEGKSAWKGGVEVDKKDFPIVSKHFGNEHDDGE